MEEIDLLQNELDLHLKTLKKVDETIRHLNVTDNSTQSVPNPNNKYLTDLTIKNRDIKAADDSNRVKRVSSLGSNGSNNRLRSTIARDTTNDEAKNLKRKLSEETPRKLRRTANDDNQSGSDDETHNSRNLIKSSVVASNMPIKRREDLIRIQNKFTGAEQRNKRIVGVILGTLRQFKSDDTERSNTTQAINRKELEKKIEIKKIEEKTKIIEEKKKLEEEKSLALNRIKILEEKILLTKEFTNWKNNQLQYKKFIRTKTKPFIFYLPKELDTKSSSLLEETSIQIDDSIAKKLKITEDEIKRLQKEEDSMNTDKNELENKENKEISKLETKEEDNSSESEMDEDKNTIVRIGDEEEEEETQTIKKEEASIEAQESKKQEINESTNIEIDDDNQEKS